MLYKKLIINLLTVFIMRAKIYAEKNIYLKYNINTNYLPKIFIKNNNLTAEYCNLFNLNKLGIQLNVSNHYCNNLYNLSATYKINKNFNIKIEKAKENKFIYSIINCSFIIEKIFNGFNIQITYFLRNGLNFEITYNYDEDGLQQFIYQKINIINNLSNNETYSNYKHNNVETISDNDPKQQVIVNKTITSNSSEQEGRYN